MGFTHFHRRAVLFDMDGTLMDSTVAVERVWRRWAGRHSLDGDHIVSVAHGRRTIETVRAVAPHLPAQAETDWIEEQEVQDRDGVVAIRGVHKVLAAIPPGRWAVVTSATRRLALARLNHVGIAPPPVLITADDVQHGKPDPEGYLKAAATLGVTPGECLVFEDVPAGIQAAINAGMAAIGVTGTCTAAELHATACISDFRQVKVEVERECVLVLTVEGQD